MAAGRANSGQRLRRTTPQPALRDDRRAGAVAKRASPRAARTRSDRERVSARRHLRDDGARAAARPRRAAEPRRFRSEEHTSELQSLMRISYAVFCLKKKKNNTMSMHQTRIVHNAIQHDI